MIKGIYINNNSEVDKKSNGLNIFLVYCIFVIAEEIEIIYFANLITFSPFDRLYFSIILCYCIIYFIHFRL